MAKVSLLGAKLEKRFSQGQALSEKLYDSIGANPARGNKLGDSPLIVADYSPDITVQVKDPLLEPWLQPGEDVSKWLDEALRKSLEIYSITEDFLRGDIQLRSTVWVKDNGREIQFLTNKPHRALIIVRLGKGEYIALKSLEGFPYVLSRGKLGEEN